MFDLIGSLPEPWAWVWFQLRESEDRPEWFPHGKISYAAGNRTLLGDGSKTGGFQFLMQKAFGGPAVRKFASLTEDWLCGTERLAQDDLPGNLVSLPPMKREAPQALDRGVLGQKTLLNSMSVAPADKYIDPRRFVCWMLEFCTRRPRFAMSGRRLSARGLPWRRLTGRRRRKRPPPPLMRSQPKSKRALWTTRRRSRTARKKRVYSTRLRSNCDGGRLPQRSKN